jgi:hypothetical protein
MSAGEAVGHSAKHRPGAGAGAGAVGVGAVACAACCAGPIWTALAALGVATAIGYLVAGVVALVVGAAALAWMAARRRRRRGQRARTSDPVTLVASPTRRAEA